MSTSTDPNRVVIFDTTLRDGEQSPGCSMNLAEKLEMARALRDARRGRDRGRLPDRLARRLRGGPGHRPPGPRPDHLRPGPLQRRPTSTAPAEALKDAPRPRIHVFLATSAIHREFKLQDEPEEIVKRAVEGVKRARGYCEDVEFSPEDAARTELDFLAEVVEKAIEAGATTLNIPDTVGYAVPSQYAAVIRHLKKNVRGIDNVRLQRPLPQRPRPGRRQQPGRAAGRGPAGRMHHQRHRRAGRQHAPSKKSSWRSRRAATSTA